MPPTLLVCVNDKSSVGFAFRQNKAICVNTVGPEHERLAIVFGGKTPNEERFAAADWKLGKSGAPMLESSLISFDCQIVQSSVVGTHRVLVCEVLDIAKGDQSMASVYFARQFHSIPI
jgi:flavin reductase